MKVLRVGDKIVCFRVDEFNLGVVVLNKIYTIVKIKFIGGYGDCIFIINEYGDENSYSINKVNGYNYESWFMEIKEIRKNKLKKLNEKLLLS